MERGTYFSWQQAANKQVLASLFAATILVQPFLACLPSLAAVSLNADSSKQESTVAAPAGTLLLPLSPKLDLGKPDQNKTANLDQSEPPQDAQDNDDLPPQLATMAVEKGKIEDDADNETIHEDTTLKGTIQIVADDTEFDQDKNTFLGTGNAIAIIDGQNSKLEADTILYDQNDQTMDARGNVRILRNGQLTTGSAFKFKVTSDEYLITKPDTELQGSQIIARHAHGSKEGLAFKEGTMSLPVPFFFTKNFNSGPLSYREDTQQMRVHPDGYLPDHPSFRFKAKKIVYERYKQDGNLTVFGGRIEMGDFSIPVGNFVSTVGQTETKVVMPVTPYIGNNLMVGGMNIGPQFNTGIGKDTVLSWSPMVQIGGRDLGTNSNTNTLGLAARVGIDSKDYQAHLAYGSSTNFLVGDVKAKVWRSIRFQGGINRFLDDGMMGLTRARLLAEVKDTHQYFNIPYIALLQFRSSAGWAQDNPQLVNVSSLYSQLHGSPTSTVMKTGYRLQEQITVQSHPIFSIGDDKWGAKSFLYGGLAARGYSTGDSDLISQAGPILDLHLDRLRLQTGYIAASVNGNSPFVFDQYIQGSQSAYVMGDVKVSKYLTLGTLIGYNLSQKLAYAKQLQAAIGPGDFKLVVAKDFVLNNYRIGFNLLHGAPVQFDKLVLKGSPDQGQLGGI